MTTPPPPPYTSDAASILADEIFLEHIPTRSRVIDLGCGDGRLMEMLRERNGCEVLGVEVDHLQVLRAIGRGVPIIQADLDRGLSDIPSDAFDVAVLSQTLQQVRKPGDVLKEMLRLARTALVLVPNFGHWRVRLQIVKHGRTPVTAALPYQWYDTPNLHFMSMHDFRELAAMLGCGIRLELPIIGGKAVPGAWGANLRAESALYLIERASCDRETR